MAFNRNIVLTMAAAIALAGAALVAVPASAGGRLLDVQVFDRSANRTLPVYRHQGRLYVIGTPGSEYAITLRNRGGADLLAVLSVDGVNAISGETAAPDQTGYVLDARQQAEIRGWRKDSQRSAAFYFTALPDAYAARTGRPDNVGVIGVAVFRAKEAQPSPPPAALAPREAAPEAAYELADSASPRAQAEGRRSAAAPPLGTGHGRSEHAPIRFTSFERASPVPDETITIFYDSRANLVARGILREPIPVARRAPDAFPGAAFPGFVPDPPVR
jgi:hypothetical protein